MDALNFMMKSNIWMPLPPCTVGLKVIRIVSVRSDLFSDLDSFSRIYLKIFDYGNEFGFFFVRNENEYESKHNIFCRVSSLEVLLPPSVVLHGHNPSLELNP